VRDAMTPKEQWSAVDRYLDEMLVKPDETLEQALRVSAEAGLPPINVSPAQGKLLHLLARAIGARKILEIGTLGGYSTIWLARALPAGGKLITLEAESKHAEVAQSNMARAGLTEIVEVRVGLAIDLLPRLESDRLGPFDLIFIDADKQSTVEYFKWAMKLSRVGSLIMVDNVVRGGKVIDAGSTDSAVRAIRRFNDMLSQESRVSATAIQTVGVKGYDGFVLAMVVA